MAMIADEFVKNKYAEDKKAFEQSYDGKIVGVLEFNGKFRSFIFPSAEHLKLTTGRKGYPDLVYAGKISLKDGEYAGLEEVDMSKVELKGFPESFLKEIKKYGEKRKKEREQKAKKLSSYSSQMPDVIKSMIGGIDSETGYAIMVCLSKDGDQTHQKLKDKLGLNDRELREAIKPLQCSALVDEWAPIYFIKDTESNQTKGVKIAPIEKSSYGVTLMGKHFMTNLARNLDFPTKKESKEWEKTENKRLGIDPEKVRIERMKKTKKLKPEALEILKEKPNINPEDFREKLHVNHEDFYRVAKVIGYKPRRA